MQRKALKQLNKVTQWTNEKVFSGDKTQLSDDFQSSEREIEPRRIGIERLHATSIPFFEQLTKRKPTADPYPPQGSGKDKILHTEAVGLVMIDYGGDIRGPYGDALSKYGRARCKLAVAQEEFGSRLSENYIAGMEQALEAVNEYKAMRKKLDSRRLTLDAAISRQQGSKKDSRMLEEEVRMAQERFEEIEEETHIRLQEISQQEEQQFAGLGDLLDAELQYFATCLRHLEELRDTWPTESVSVSTTNRPRAKSNASARSAGRNKSYSRPSDDPSDEDEDEITPNRSRSQSNASAGGKTKEKRSMMPSFGSFSKKSGLSLPSTRRRSSGRGGYGDDDRMALHSEEEEEPSSPVRYSANTNANGRARSSSTLSASQVSLAPGPSVDPPSMRRTKTTPGKMDGHYVKALYDFPGTAADELPLRAGQVVEVKKEVSDDWWIGEFEGRSGLFPKTYCEEYVPTPTTIVPPPRQRTLPPPAGAPVKRTIAPSVPMPMSIPERPSMEYQTDDSYEDHSIFDDGDENASTSLSTAPAPTPQSLPRPNLLPPIKKAAPPPPPASRRSQSSSNLMTIGNTNNTNNNNVLNGHQSFAPPSSIGRKPFAHTLESSPEGSPFGGSGDEHDDFDFHPQATAPPKAPVPTRQLSHGLSSMHISSVGAGGGGGGEGIATSCKECDCDGFRQNVFKVKGTCANCFHVH